MKIALLGYGKMGKTIEKMAIQAGHEIVLKIGSQNLFDLNIENLRKADVAIEFSTPNTVVKNIMLCFEAGTPVIIGTTSWSENKKSIEETCQNTGNAMLSASNFSLGVNLFFALNKKLAQLMNAHHNYKLSLTEIHHTAKLDAPSGTAITLAEEIINHHHQYHQWEEGIFTSPEVIPIRCIREPNVPGTHEIKYTSDEDVIEIKHTAINREGFAKGAILAAQWLIGKKGVFEMKDVLGL
ncbi:MAG TPA: 4-hydroxy-tetrahydrodipicolinate reductase [Bacteroidia bacterium]|nr:4-hydroxy-tetrahydrodipicolinate reductase [Bacteroidia bacterium]